MLNFSKKGEARSLDQVKHKLGEITAFYRCQSTLSVLSEIADDVRGELLQNKENFNSFGESNRETTGGWWPIETLERTNDPVRLDLRRTGLRDRLHGQGLRRFLNQTIVRGLIDEAGFDQIREFTGYPHKGLHEELMGYHLSDGSKDMGLKLRDLQERFELANNGNIARLRYRVVLPMATFGLLRARIDKDNRYDIRIGLVGEIFHCQVFTPVRIKFET